MHWDAKEIKEIAVNENHVTHLSLNQFQYINEKTKGFYYELNDKGREAKSRGGHFAYLRFLDEKKKLENERQERKDKSDKLDLVIKQWQVKTKYISYIVSFVALGFSISSFFSNENKSVSLQTDKQNVQNLQEHVITKDFLLEEDTFILKK